MGDGIIAKFIYFWIFLMGGLFAAKIFGIADTAANMAVLSVSLAFVYVGWNLLRARGKKKAAEKAAANVTTSRKGSRPSPGHKKKKR